MRSHALSQPPPIPLTQALTEVGGMLLVLVMGICLVCIPVIDMHYLMMHFYPTEWQQPMGMHPVAATIGTIAYILWCSLCMEGVMEAFRTISPDSNFGWKPGEAGLMFFIAVLGGSGLVIGTWPLLHNLAT